jgi:hypothetical protein
MNIKKNKKIDLIEEEEKKEEEKENDDEVEDDEYEVQIVELINEDGKLERLVLEASFHLDDVQYAVLREENSEEGMIYSVDETEDGEMIFNIIEDEEELNEVIEIYEAMADELI